jgi:multicomponent Na+:H+ antiporter subunit B
VIFKTVTPFLTALMLVYSVSVLLAGHNAPGGGFIGGLIAASAFAVLGLSSGVSVVRRTFVLHPLSWAAIGLLLSLLAGLLSLFADRPFMTGLWYTASLPFMPVTLSTPLLFDIGVYGVVLGTLSSIILVLEERETDP